MAGFRRSFRKDLYYFLLKLTDFSTQILGHTFLCSLEDFCCINRGKFDGVFLKKNLGCISRYPLKFYKDTVKKD
jgi:hypothetical protein